MKQLLEFCDILNDQGLRKCYQPRPSVRLITLTSTLIIADIPKTSCNNCLIYDEDKVGEDRVLKVRENISLETCIEAVLKILNLFSPELSLVGPVL